MATKAELRDSIRAAEIYADSEVFLDDNYGLPNLSWVEDVLIPTFFDNFLTPLGCQYHRGKDGWDCDDLALALVMYARILNKTASKGIAVGLLGYHDPELGPHACNIIWSRADGEVFPNFYDPTRRVWLNLKPEILLSAITLIV